MFLAILFYLSWFLNLLGGPRLGAEIVILTSSNSAVALRCHVVFDPPGTYTFVKRGCDLEVQICRFVGWYLLKLVTPIPEETHSGLQRGK